MLKKVMVVIGVLFLIIASFCIYSIYRFLNLFGDLVNEELSHSYFYTRNKKGIVYSFMGNWFSLGKYEIEVDMNTFQVLGKSYSKDSKITYFKHKKVNIEVDVPTFTLKDSAIPVDKNHVYTLNDWFYKENKSNVSGFRILEDADPKTYQYIGDNYDFAKDKNYIFKEDIKCTEVDHGTFEIINGRFCKDTINGYHYSYRKPLSKVENINVHQVVSTTESHIRDDKYVYFYLSSRKDEVIG